MLRAPEADWSASMAAPLILVALGLFMVLLAETCRIPVDDPNTHLELTMIHEAMVLDHGGPFLGAISYSASMKLLILGSILLHVTCPFSLGDGAADWLLFSAELLVLSVVIGSVESLMARLRMNRVPYFLPGPCSVAAAASSCSRGKIDVGASERTARPRHDPQSLRPGVGAASSP